ncbi:MAG: hypothetical protein NW220_22865 [Leptolyngbyaceae cyanobacterium bins.349]|nr:hypothetical protein [Leptolyngbyaceae cyanobacterium bins.349]
MLVREQNKLDNSIFKVGYTVVNIQTDDYSIRHDVESATVYFRGFLRLDGIEKYQPVMDILLNAVNESTNFTIDLRELEFLNSSGISMLSMFIVKVRDRGGVDLILKGSDKILWQTKSLKNLQRLMPSLTLRYE